MIHKAFNLGAELGIGGPTVLESSLKYHLVIVGKYFEYYQPYDPQWRALIYPLYLSLRCPITLPLERGCHTPETGGVMAFGVLAFSSALLPFLIRLRFDHEGTRYEFTLTTLLSVWLYRRPLQDLVTWLPALLLEHSLWTAIFALLLFLVYFYSSFTMISSLRVAEKPLHDAIESETSFLKPLIFPSRTSHVRLFPKKHGFSYSYLLVGVPIGWRGSINSLLSADLDSIECNSPHRKRGWFSVNGADYLSRDYDANGLQGKLARYLKNQVFQVAEYLQKMAKLKDRMKILETIRSSTLSRLRAFWAIPLILCHFGISTIRKRTSKL